MTDILDLWRTDVEVSGPVRRDSDGRLARRRPPAVVRGCLLAPSDSQAPGLADTATSEATSDRAVVYAPPGAPIHHLDTVTVPAGHPMTGVWTVESVPATWPLGTAATITRR